MYQLQVEKQNLNKDNNLRWKTTGFSFKFDVSSAILHCFFRCKIGRSYAWATLAWVLINKASALNTNHTFRTTWLAGSWVYVGS